MGIQLTTGQKFSLRKQAPGLNVLLCGLRWEVRQKKGLKKIFQSDLDLDISVLCLNEAGKIEKSSDVVYYGNLTHPSGAISHLGDNLTGENITPVATEKHEDEDETEIHDKEQILVTLPQVPKRIKRLVIFTNIYEAASRRQNLGQLENAHVRLVDLEHEEEIASYDLSHDDFKDDTGMILAEIYRQENQWQVEVVGKGVKVASLQELVEQYYEY
ncbi:TerD family protein [Euhalothece natronophila Z-M001]|uniref:TerD family protein n=1 Tax=Euhalothece natronophila Z-M001 TaxID=522448 RepID=A0A5B8NTL4_9CHRO|nr:TerD family protein [Euhalothece natronophila]QDZ41380.1 TerD family protein [Euhalothece natronophila Z-M001]